MTGIETMTDFEAGKHKMKPVKNTFKNVEIREVWIDKEKMVVEFELSSISPRTQRGRLCIDYNN